MQVELSVKGQIVKREVPERLFIVGQATVEREELSITMQDQCRPL
jgi:hypothetical protein